MDATEETLSSGVDLDAVAERKATVCRGENTLGRIGGGPSEALRQDMNICSFCVDHTIKHLNSTPYIFVVKDTLGIVSNIRNAHLFTFDNLACNIACLDSRNSPRRVSYTEYIQTLELHTNTFIAVTLPEAA